MVLPEGDGVTIKVQTSKRDVCYLWHQMLKLKQGPMAVLITLPPTSLLTALVKAVWPSCENKAQGPPFSDRDPS